MLRAARFAAQLGFVVAPEVVAAMTEMAGRIEIISAERLRRTYDDLETRIARLQEQEELDSIRPDLDGNQIMELLGISPGREVGEAYNFLLELRLDHGPMSEADAKAALLAWWAGR
jgi:poly(A) polymerase